MGKMRRILAIIMMAVLVVGELGSDISAYAQGISGVEVESVTEVTADISENDVTTNDVTGNEEEEIPEADAEENPEEDVIEEEEEIDIPWGEPLVNMYGSSFEWEWGEEHGVAVGKCEACGTEFVVDGCEGSSDAESKLDRFFCDGCGRCSVEENSDCWKEYHCEICYECVDDDYCDGCKNEVDTIICYDCLSDFIESNENTSGHCYYCGEHLGDGVTPCDCEYSLIRLHCEDCSELQCEECSLCLVIAGEETEAVSGDGCVTHALCNNCIEKEAGNDGIHCKECFRCDEEICDECGMCTSCTEGEEHCPECNHCFGNSGIEWCQSGGEDEHCIYCCEENGWLCEQCGECAEGQGLELCEDCGLCWECCLQNSEDAGCCHEYCIKSSDYEEHLCPECGLCPQDTECEDCGLCEECAENYHCEHGICPDSFDYEEHICIDCGDCFEPDSLCDWCGRCENCAANYHCEKHNLCPDNWEYEDIDTHFFCEQCGECFSPYEGEGYCIYCKLCDDCCLENTREKGCDCTTAYCIMSPRFMDHWCYTDNQCAFKCEHNKVCAHKNLSDEYFSDNTGHWRICEDCGASVDKVAHSLKYTTVSESDPLKRVNGVDSVDCSICNRHIKNISIPYNMVKGGKPVIISQPKDYGGYVSSTNFSVVSYASFSVRAIGEDLKYEWHRIKGGVDTKLKNGGDFYENYGGQYPDVRGADTPYLTVAIDPESCHKKIVYYCIITNEKGSNTTRKVSLKSKHLYNNKTYSSEGPKTHAWVCGGEDCTEVKRSGLPHRFTEWEVKKVATSSEPGEKRQTCIDCGYVNKKAIPIVEINHVHKFDRTAYNLSHHWYECSCGIRKENSSEEHKWDDGKVTTEPTEKKKGVKTYKCSVCGLEKTESLDKLPHTHAYYTIKDAGSVTELYSGIYGGGANTSKGHYVNCKSADCDSRLWTPHTLTEWQIRKQPTSESSGLACRQCSCGYTEYEFLPYGVYKIWPEVPEMTEITVNSVKTGFAKKGDTVTLTFKPIPGRKWGSDSKWIDMYGSGAYGDISSDLGLVRITDASFESNKNKTVVTFTMPDGPIGIAFKDANCDHKNGTVYGGGLEATCTGYGREQDKLCKDCGKVMEEGKATPPLGHDLNDFPDAGSEDIEYCYFENGGVLQKREDTETGALFRGYEGDYTCKRCNKKVRGKTLPQVHGLIHGNLISGKVDHETYLQNVKEAGCTSTGYTGDTYCKYCNERISLGKKTESTGHKWGKWDIVVPSTPKKKGYEERVCLNDSTHKERHNLELAKDLTLEADKARAKFDFTYGNRPEPVIINYTSVGADTVSKITKVSLDGAEDLYKVRVNGMSIVVEFNEDYLGEAMELEDTSAVLTVTGIKETDKAWEIFAPKVELSTNVRNSNARFKFKAEGAWIESVNKVSLAGKTDEYELKAGDLVKLTPADSANFACYEVVSDISNSLDKEYTNKDQYFRMPSCDVVIKTRYKAEFVNVTFKGLESHTADRSTLIEAGQKVEDPNMGNCHYCGKQFIGWYADEDYKQPFDFDRKIYNDTIIYPLWNEAPQYLIHFDMKGHGTQIRDNVALWKNKYKITEPEVPTEPDYTFGGWYTDTDLKTPFVFAEAVKRDVTLYAKWVKAKVNLHTVSFVVDGVSMAPRTVEDGKKLTKPEDPILGSTTKIFTGWYTDPEFTKQYDFKSKVKSDLTLYGKLDSKILADPDGLSVRFETILNSSDFFYNGGTGRYEAVYTGSSIEPKVIVSYNRDSNVKLVEGKDYTIKYGNNKNVDKKGKAATVTVTGKGNYKGSKKINFYIVPKPIMAADILYTDYIYIKSGAKPVPTLIHNGRRLSSDDYKITCETFSNLKIKEDTLITIQGKGNYTGIIEEVQVYVLDDTGIKQNKLKLVVDKIYKESMNTEYNNGTPRVLEDFMYHVEDGNGTVIDRSNYYLYYENNVNAGTGRVTVVGKGLYSGIFSEPFTFKIKPNTKAVIETKILDPEVYYSSKGATPNIRVARIIGPGEEVALKEGVDYSISWSNNKNAGKKAAYTVNFKGNYKGHKPVKNVKFEIKPLKIEGDYLAVTAPNLTYSKAGSYTSAPYVTYKNVLLKKGTDYTVEYIANGVDITKNKKYKQDSDKVSVTVNIIPKGNYTGKKISVKDCYTIKKLTTETVDLSKAKITKKGNISKAIPAMDYTGDAVVPEYDIFVPVKSGKKTKWITLSEAGLRSGTDYEVVYINNVKPGNATLILKAKSTSTKAVKSKAAKFNIRQNNISILTIFR